MVTPRIERYVRATFPEEQVATVLELLHEWRISYESEPPHERLIAAVVLLAEGRADGLAVGVDIASLDWRDLLMAAGMEHDNWGTRFNEALERAERAEPD